MKSTNYFPVQRRALVKGFHLLTTSLLILSAPVAASTCEDWLKKGTRPRLMEVSFEQAVFNERTVVLDSMLAQKILFQRLFDNLLKVDPSLMTKVFEFQKHQTPINFFGRQLSTAEATRLVGIFKGTFQLGPFDQILKAARVAFHRRGDSFWHPAEDEDEIEYALPKQVITEALGREYAVTDNHTWTWKGPDSLIAEALAIESKMLKGKSVLSNYRFFKNVSLMNIPDFKTFTELRRRLEAEEKKLNRPFLDFEELEQFVHSLIKKEKRSKNPDREYIRFLQLARVDYQGDNLLTDEWENYQKKMVAYLEGGDDGLLEFKKALEDAEVGGPNGHLDRQIIADTFYAALTPIRDSQHLDDCYDQICEMKISDRSKPSMPIIFFTADSGILRGLLRLRLEDTHSRTEVDQIVHRLKKGDLETVRQLPFVSMSNDYFFNRSRFSKVSGKYRSRLIAIPDILPGMGRHPVDFYFLYSEH